MICQANRRAVVGDDLGSATNHRSASAQFPSRCPPGPSSSTVRARRRCGSLPLSAHTASLSNTSTDPVSSIALPFTPCLRHRAAVWHERNTYFCEIFPPEHSPLVPALSADMATNFFGGGLPHRHERRGRTGTINQPIKYARKTIDRLFGFLDQLIGAATLIPCHRFTLSVAVMVIEADHRGGDPPMRDAYACPCGYSLSKPSR